MDTAIEVFETEGPLMVLWLVPAAAALVAVVTTRLQSTERRRRVVLVTRVVLLFYLAAVAVVTLWPLDFNLSFDRLAGGNWIPGEGTLGFVTSGNPRQEFLGGRDFLANIVLFAPLGLLLPFSFYQWRGVPFSVFLLAQLAFGLEIAQGLFVGERTFDVDDAIACVVGAVGAALIASMIRPLVLRTTATRF